MKANWVVKLSVLIVICSIAHGQAAATMSVNGSQNGAAVAIRQLTETGRLDDASSSILGYALGEEAGFATNPHGSCSSPVPLPEVFEPACRTHDLGYDLLRSTAEEGSSVPAGARRSIDRQFFGRLFESCAGEGAGCRVMAGVVVLAVGANTIRQRGGVPVEESWPWS